MKDWKHAKVYEYNIEIHRDDVTLVWFANLKDSINKISAIGHSTAPMSAIKAAHIRYEKKLVDAGILTSHNAA